MDPRPRILGGRYRVESLLGRGEMADVFRGTDTALGRPVAIKVLAAEHSRDEEFVDRFRREARAVARLTHPGIVSVYDAGSDGAVHYIVMELVEGRTLAGILKDGPLPSHRAADIVGRVAEALAFAPEAGLVHRDVKPANVMVMATGEIKVMDFGIARATAGETLTRTATVLGTATYLAPEQARGEPVDARTDVYSLGVVLYECLAGRPPFSADSPVAAAYKHVREAPVPPSRLVPGLPKDVMAVSMKALAKSPAHRYANAAEMAEDLDRFLAGEPVMASPVPAAPPAQTPARQVVTGPGPRPRRWASLVISGTIAGVIAVAVTARRVADGPDTGPGLLPQDQREGRTAIPGATPNARAPGYGEEPVSNGDEGSGDQPSTEPATTAPATPSAAPSAEATSTEPADEGVDSPQPTEGMPTPTGPSPPGEPTEPPPTTGPPPTTEPPSTSEPSPTTEPPPTEPPTSPPTVLPSVTLGAGGSPSEDPGEGGAGG